MKLEKHAFNVLYTCQCGIPVFIFKHIKWNLDSYKAKQITVYELHYNDKGKSAKPFKREIISNLAMFTQQNGSGLLGTESQNPEGLRSS